MASVVDPAGKVSELDVCSPSTPAELDRPEDLRRRLAKAETRQAELSRSFEGLKLLLAQERASRTRLMDDHFVSLQVAELAAAVERERRIVLEGQLRVSLQALVAREVRIKALI